MLRGGAVLYCVVVAHVGQTEEEGMRTPVDLKVPKPGILSVINKPAVFSQGSANQQLIPAYLIRSNVALHIQYVFIITERSGYINVISLVTKRRGPQ